MIQKGGISFCGFKGACLQLYIHIFGCLCVLQSLQGSLLLVQLIGDDTHLLLQQLCVRVSNAVFALQALPLRTTEISNAYSEADATTLSRIRSNVLHY